MEVTCARRSSGPGGDEDSDSDAGGRSVTPGCSVGSAAFSFGVLFSDGEGPGFRNHSHEYLRGSGEGSANRRVPRSVPRRWGRSPLGPMGSSKGVPLAIDFAVIAAFPARKHLGRDASESVMWLGNRPGEYISRISLRRPRPGASPPGNRNGKLKCTLLFSRRIGNASAIFGRDFSDGSSAGEGPPADAASGDLLIPARNLGESLPRSGEAGARAASRGILLPIWQTPRTRPGNLPPRSPEWGQIARAPNLIEWMIAAVWLSLVASRGNRSDPPDS